MVKHDIPKPVFDAKKYDPEGMKNMSWRLTSKRKSFLIIAFEPILKSELMPKG